MGNERGLAWFYFQKMLRSKPFLMPAIFLVILLIFADYLYFRDRLYPGIYLKDMSLGGKTRDEVRAVLGGMAINFVGPEGEDTVLLCKEMGIRPDAERIFNTAHIYGRRSCWPLSYMERLRLYLEKEFIPLNYHLEQEQLSQALSKLATAMEREPQDAYFSVTSASAGTAQALLFGEKYGFQTDTRELTTAIHRVLKHPRASLTVLVPGQKLSPSISISTFKEKGIRALMSSFATLFDKTNADRVHNITLAASIVNNYFIAPGEVFSLNRLIGDTTPEKGYKKAMTMQGGELVEGFGGGLCQVSTTLYNAALLAGLEIVERHNHQMTVPYIAPGRDATIVYGVRDLKFRNNKEHYILIHGSVDEESIRFSFFGAPLAENIIIYTRTLAVFEPWLKYEYTPELPPGEEELIRGSPGYLVEVWQYVYGKDNYPGRREKISADSYNSYPTIIRRSSLHDD